MIERFPTRDWLRAMFDKSTDHGNDVMVAHFVFLFLEQKRNFNRIGRQNCLCYMVTKMDNNFPWCVLLSTIKIMSKNVQNLTVKPLTSSS